jgi:hypothetical protein
MARRRCAHVEAGVDSSGHPGAEPAESDSRRHGQSFPVNERLPQPRPPIQQVPKADDLSLDDLLEVVRIRSASDLHLTANARPTIRVDGSLVAVADFPS